MSTSAELQENLDALDAFMNSRAFVGWKAAREVEITNLNYQIAVEAKDWAEVNQWRGARDNIISILESFEVTREDLKTALTKAREAESTLAASRKV
jgi:hypothetical protein